MHDKAFMGPAKAEPRTYSFGTRDRMDERYDFIRTVGDGRYYYFRNDMPHRPLGVNLGFAWLLKSYQDWETAWLAGTLLPVQAGFFEEKPFEEFYDLQTDPDQVVNLIGTAEQAGRIADFRAALNAQMLAVRDAGVIPEGSDLESYAVSQDPEQYWLEVLMMLGATVAQRDPIRLEVFASQLASPNLAVRYWAVTGPLALGEAAGPARARLDAVLASDACLNVQIVAETLTRLGRPDQAVPFLREVLDHPLPFAIKLQALNAVTFIGTAAEPALPQVRRMANEEQPDLRTAGRYLQAVLEGTYRPGFQSFDVPWLLRRMAEGRGPAI